MQLQVLGMTVVVFTALGCLYFMDSNNVASQAGLQAVGAASSRGFASHPQHCLRDLDGLAHFKNWSAQSQEGCLQDSDNEPNRLDAS